MNVGQLLRPYGDGGGMGPIDGRMDDGGMGLIDGRMDDGGMRPIGVRGGGMELI
jgi:hypothetical protein